MISKVAILLPGTVIKNDDGDFGTLRAIRYDQYGILCWLVDWANQDSEFIPFEEIKRYHLV